MLPPPYPIMNDAEIPQDPCYLLHRFGHETDDKVEGEGSYTVDFSENRGGIVAKLLKPRPEIVRKYTLPTGTLDNPIILEGSPLSVAIEETAEDTILLPHLSILSLPRDPEASEKLARMLEPSYEVQLKKLRKAIGGIFSEKVGISRSEKELDGLVSTKGKLYIEIEKAIEQRLGLKVKWLIKADPKTQLWIRSLQAELSQVVTQSFNKESRTSQFNLTFSSRVLSVKPSRFHIVQRRARAGITPAQEKEEILKIVFNTLNPGFGVFGSGRQISNHPAFWPMVEAAFTQVVQPRIAEEFGYEITFLDFRRERTEAEGIALERLENSELMLRPFEAADTDLAGAQNHLQQLREDERIAIREDDLDADSDRLVRIRTNIKDAEKAVRAAEKRRDKAQLEMESTVQRPVTGLSGADEGQAKNFLLQFSKLLQIKTSKISEILEENASSQQNAQSDNMSESDE